jgi:hypothetical protein
MVELDRRYEAKVRKEGGAMMAKKKREQGVPSSSEPPDDAPSWAIRGLFLHGTIYFNFRNSFF